MTVMSSGDLKASPRSPGGVTIFNKIFGVIAGSNQDKSQLFVKRLQSGTDVLG